MTKRTVILFLFSFLLVALPAVQNLLFEKQDRTFHVMDTDGETEDISLENGENDTEDSEVNCLLDTSHYFDILNTTKDKTLAIIQKAISDIIPHPPQA